MTGPDLPVADAERLEEVHGRRVLHLPAAGPALATPADAMDHIGSASFTGVDVLAVPVARLTPEFFRLRTGLAGEILQKAVNYHVVLAVVGDVARFVDASDAFGDLVAESNRGQHVWFVADDAALTDRLARLPQA